MLRPAAILLIGSCISQAQSTARFEAVDVHRSGPGMNAYTLLSGGVMRGARYDLRKATMLDLIRIAYHVEPEAVVGGPNWLEFDRFDIAAKAPANSSPETLRLMLQSLLAERFRLQLHHGTRLMPAFALEMGKGKPKMTQADGTDTPDCQYQAQPGNPTFTGSACRHMTMKDFVEWLHGVAGDYLTDPVVDATGLEGSWDFDLKWNNRSTVLPSGTERTTIFNAIEQQLGLSLVSREAPAPVLLIDRVNEAPTPNAPDIAQLLPPRRVEFEVADLKPSPPDQAGGRFAVIPGGRLEIANVALSVLMLAAWDIDYGKPERFANLPKWTESARFSIHAQPPAGMMGAPVRGLGYPDDETRLMLRTLLVDRFRIKWHYEDRPVEAYSLVAGKLKTSAQAEGSVVRVGGSPQAGRSVVRAGGMKAGDPSHRANCKVARTVANDPRDANPLLSELLQCENATMAQFAMKLQELEPYDFTYPAEDATGLSGTWNFLLSFSPGWLVGQKNPDGTPNGAIPIEEAIGKQLGLKLEKRKRMLPVVVIDHMEEKPSEN